MLTHILVFGIYLTLPLFHTAWTLEGGHSTTPSTGRTPTSKANAATSWLEAQTPASEPLSRSRRSWRVTRASSGVVSTSTTHPPGTSGSTWQWSVGSYNLKQTLMLRVWIDQLFHDSFRSKKVKNIINTVVLSPRKGITLNFTFVNTQCDIFNLLVWFSIPNSVSQNNYS